MDGSRTPRSTWAVGLARASGGAQADANAGRVIERWTACGKGGDVLLIAAPTTGTDGVARDRRRAELVAAGSGQPRRVRRRGDAGQKHLHARLRASAGRIDAIGGFLAGRDWVNRLVPAAEAGSVDQRAPPRVRHLACLRRRRPVRRARTALQSRPVAGKATHLDCGQHGGLARYERPF